MAFLYNALNRDASVVIGTGENVINFYYTPRTDLSYTVEYYFNGVIDNSLTEVFNNQTYGREIKTYTDNVREGYRLDYIVAHSDCKIINFQFLYK